VWCGDEPAPFVPAQANWTMAIALPDRIESATSVLLRRTIDRPHARCMLQRRLRASASDGSYDVMYVSFAATLPADIAAGGIQPARLFDNGGTHCFHVKLATKAMPPRRRSAGRAKIRAFDQERETP